MTWTQIKNIASRCVGRADKIIHPTLRNLAMDQISVQARNVTLVDRRRIILEIDHLLKEWRESKRANELCSLCQDRGIETRDRSLTKRN